MKTIDRVHFILPEDEELLVAAMTILQKYVNNYKARSTANDVTGGKQEFELRYSARASGSLLSLWDLLAELEFKLDQKAVPHLDDLDAVFDMSDERLLAWADSGKHAVQVCGIMCGEESTVVPLVRLVKPKLHGDTKWYQLDNSYSYDYLTSLSDGDVTGVVGPASGFTYIAAAMGLPVIELIPRSRNKAWLSKWVNRGYRLIYDTGDNVENMRLVNQAKASIMEYLLSRKDASCEVANVLQ